MKIKNVLSLFLVTALLGLTSVFLYQTQNESGKQESENQQLIDIITNQESDIEEMETKIEELRAAIDAELDQQTQGLSAISSLRNSLQSARYFSGLSERSGSGILLTLTDNVGGAEQAKMDNPDTYRPENFIIHDKNLLYIVNDIKAANPDGIAINNQRIISDTNIRCVGTVILVNDRRLAPPYQISILGDTRALTNAVFESNEVEYLVTSGFDITYETRDMMTLPAYKGNLNLQYAESYVEPQPEPEEEPVTEENDETPATETPEPTESETTEETDQTPEEEPDQDTGTDEPTEEPPADTEEDPTMEPEEPPIEDPAPEEPSEEEPVEDDPTADSSDEEVDGDD